jgi:hypothetical protein
MDKEEKLIQTVEDKYGRRNFLKRISKYFVGFGAFMIASHFGLKRDGEIRLGKMKNTEFGLSEAHGRCGFGGGCAGGGGQCGFGGGCAGGGGQCGFGGGCAGK